MKFTGLRRTLSFIRKEEGAPPRQSLSSPKLKGDKRSSPLARKNSGPEASSSSSSSSSSSDTDADSSSSGSERSLEPPVPLQSVPSDDSSSSSNSNNNMVTTTPPVPESETACPSDWPLFIPRDSLALPAAPRVPMYKRVEHEKRTPSLEIEDPHVAKASAHKLSFRDSERRTVRYALRPSAKKSRSTWLELLVAGEEPRKVKAIAIHDARDKFVIRDSGKDVIEVPLESIEVVTRALILLCKITRVKLDCVDGSPALRRVLSDLDLHHPLKTALSYDGDLSRRGGGSSFAHAQERDRNNGTSSSSSSSSSSSPSGSSMRKVVSTTGLSQMMGGDPQQQDLMAGVSSPSMRKSVSTMGLSSQMNHPQQQQGHGLSSPHDNNNNNKLETIPPSRRSMRKISSTNNGGVSQMRHSLAA